MIVGEDDWNDGVRRGWDNKPHAPFSNDEDREKDEPIKT